MTPEETLAALRETGLSRPETEVPLLTDEPKIPEYLCGPSDKADAQYDTSCVSGLGCHPEDTLARVKSVAECLERLCLMNPFRDPDPEAAHTELPGALDPVAFLTGPPTRTADHQRARESRYRWWPVIDYASGEQRAIPAQMIFLRRFPEEYPLRLEHLSTGAALGERGDQRALSSGVFEAVERDAAIAAYLTDTPPPRIAGLPPAALELVTYLRRYRLEPYIFDARSDLSIPAVVVFTIDETGIGPAVNASARAALTYEDALAGALLESIQARRGIRLAELPDHFPGQSEVTSLEQRFYFWYPAERITLLRSWLETDREVSYASLTDKPPTLAQVIDQLSGKGYRILVADITLPELAKRGFEVLKVVIPELHPLYLDERAKTRYSVRHGLIDSDPSLAPHPFV